MTDLIDMTPPRTSGWQMMLRTLLGIVIGLLLAFLIFIVLKVIGDVFVQQTNNVQVITNPLFPLILLIVAFVVIFVGNTIKSGLYNVFWSERYVDMTGMVRTTFLTNMVLFIIAAPLYLIFAGEIDILFRVLAYHIMFATFVTSIQLEMIGQPHYGQSHVLGSTLWFALAMMIFALIYKYTYLSEFQDKLYVYLLFPPVLSFGVLPLAKWLREIIYRKRYEGGSDFFYAASPSDTLEDDHDESDDLILVDID